MGSIHASNISNSDEIANDKSNCAILPKFSFNIILPISLLCDNANEIANDNANYDIFPPNQFH